jgi:Cu-processing system permease protein
MDRRSLNRIMAVAANTFRESVREKVLYNLVFFALVMTVSGLLLFDLSARQDERILKDIGLASMDVFGTLIAIFLGVGLVRKEVERRSLYPLLAKPVRREEFLLGKFFGLGFTLFVNVLVMSAGTYLILFLTRRTVDLSLLRAIYPLYVGLLLVVAIALFLSTLTSSTLAAVGTLGAVIAGRFADVLQNMHEVAPGVPGWFARVLYVVIPNFSYFDLKDRVVRGGVVAAAQLGWISLYGVVYIGLLLSAAMIAFRSRDLE